MSKQYLDLTGLSTYDGLIKQYIDDADATKVGKIADAEGSKIVLSTSGGEISESELEVSDLMTITSSLESGYKITYWDENYGGLVTTEVGRDDFEAAIEKIEDLTAGDVPYDNTTSGLTADDVQEALDELAEASQGGVASKTVYITETAGSSSDAFSKRYGIYQGATGSAQSPVVGEKLADIDIPKDMVVEDGSVVDITFDPTDNHLYDGSTDVTEIIKGAGGTATEADAGKYIKLEIANATSSVLYIKATDLVDIYTAQQNATQIQLAIDSSNVISATIVAGSVGTTELADSAVTTAKINNSAVTAAKIADDAVTTDKIARGAVTELKISTGAVTTDKIVDSAVTTGKIADDAVTADKVAISAHTEAQTAGADGLAISVTTTDGQVSAVSGSIAANTYDAYGAAASAITTAEGYTDTAIAALDATPSQLAGTDGLALSLTEVDGVVTAISGSIAANTYETYGSIATAIAALDASVSQTASTDGLALSVTEVDGVVTGISGSIAANTYEPYGIGSIATADIENLFD